MTLVASHALAQDEAVRPPVDYAPDVSYTLTTGLADGRMAFIGYEGEIEGITSPTLFAEPGDVVQITLINGDDVSHDILLEAFTGAQSTVVNERGASSSIAFRTPEEGTLVVGEPEVDVDMPDVTSTMLHSVDVHATTGPSGGAVATQTLPGEETGFSLKALQPGLYVYHCATPMVAHHITNGMYGLVLLEPRGGLPEVDREFYVV